MDRELSPQVLNDWLGYRLLVKYITGPDVDPEDADRTVTGQTEARTELLYLDQIGAYGELSTRADAGALVRKFIDQELTDKQRVAMTVVMFEGMPLEEAARRMGTTRGALYKLMHDARKRLKRRMEEDGLSPKDLLEELAQR